MTTGLPLRSEWPTTLDRPERGRSGTRGLAVGVDIASLLSALVARPRCARLLGCLHATLRAECVFLAAGRERRGPWSDRYSSSHSVHLRRHRSGAGRSWLRFGDVSGATSGHAGGHGLLAHGQLKTAADSSDESSSANPPVSSRAFSAASTWCRPSPSEAARFVADPHRSFGCPTSVSS